MTAPHKLPREDVAPGVSVVPVASPTLPPATHTNCWVLGSESVTVVDPASPWPEEQERLATALSDRRVERIFLTHHHVDHVSGAEDLRARTGAPIVAHPWTAEAVAFPVDRVVDEGDVFEIDERTWKLYHTPGHAPGHLILHDPEAGSIIAGDMVAGEGTIVLAPPEGDLAAYLSQLGRMRDLAPSRLMPAHGPEILNAVELLQQYIDHRHMRTEQIRSALRQADGPLRPIELVPGIYAGLIPEVFYPVAAEQVLCHLEWLVSQGEVQEDGDAFHY